MFNLIPETCADDPYSALDYASDMLQALEFLIGNSTESLEGRHKSGVSLMLRGIADCIDDAKEITRIKLIEARSPEAEQVLAGSDAAAEAQGQRPYRSVNPGPITAAVREAIRNGALKELNAGGNGEGTLSARDTAIAETYRKGYELEEIASAVNLKKQTVQRIIDRLQASGDLQIDKANSDQALSA